MTLKKAQYYFICEGISSCSNKEGGQPVRFNQYPVSTGGFDIYREPVRITILYGADSTSFINSISSISK